ncbi:hypothetical protein [Micromonospora sp. NPDC005173]|uniref:hypothetical protein n=1 Tax=Micromonospora sp. NPDC005173 TaxID=3157165 RepID=UPI0033A7A858
MRLQDIAPISRSYRENLSGFHAFRYHPLVSGLGWPDDVLEQWLYDHGDNGAFLRDYGNLNLSAVAWTVEAIATQEFLAMPTGRSDGSCIDEYAADPNHWISVRQHGVHAGVSLCWATHGTWKRWPILVDRSLVDATTGLQVVEGRTRVGILRGRHRENDRVAPQHLAWVGRPAADLSQTA